jgi:predicted permease
MLQRIQSIFLLLSAIGLAIFLGTNSYVKVISETEMVAVNAFQVFHKSGDSLVQNHKTETYYIAVLAAISIVICFFVIFQFKNRLRQMLFSAVNSLFMGVALAVTVYHAQKTAPLYGGEGGEYSVGLFALFAALVFNWLANRYIRKDEKLVRDSESRLR